MLKSLEELKTNIDTLERMQKNAMVFAGDVKSRTVKLWFSRKHYEDSNGDVPPFKLDSLKDLLLLAKKHLHKMQSSATFDSDSCSEHLHSSTTIVQLAQGVLSQVSLVQAETLEPKLSIPKYYNRHRFAIRTVGVLAGVVAVVLPALPARGLPVGEALQNLFAWAGNWIFNHVVKPVNNTKQLLLGQREVSVGNPDQLQRSRAELRNMLQDYVAKELGRNPHLTQEQCAQLRAFARAGDLNAVEARLDQNNSLFQLLFGNMVQLLLINAESVKVSLSTCYG